MTNSPDNASISSYITIGSGKILPEMLKNAENEEELTGQKKNDSFFPAAEVPIGRCTKDKKNIWNWIIGAVAFFILAMALTFLFMNEYGLFDDYNGVILTKDGPNVIALHHQNFDIIIYGSETEEIPGLVKSFLRQENITVRIDLSLKSQMILPRIGTDLYWKEARCKVIGNQSASEENCSFEEKVILVHEKSLTFTERAIFENEDVKVLMALFPLTVEYSLFVSNRPLGPWEWIAFNRTFTAV